jgi:glycosyltransferase involved in cell wall biosynthesis
MKILLVTVAHYGDQPGGSQKIALDEATELRRRGEEVWVLAQGTPSLPEYEQKDGIHLLRYVPEKVALWNPARRHIHQKAAVAVLARHLPQVDAIHGHIQLAYLAAFDFYGDSVFSCYTIHSPIKMEMAIAWRHSSFLRRLIAPIGLAALKRIEADCLRRSRVVTALSQYTIDCIRRIHGKELARSVHLVPGWVDTSRYVPVDNRGRIKEQLGWPTDVPVLFTLRRLVPRMGLERLLDAGARLLAEGLKFHLVLGGSGPLRNSLEEQAKALGLSNSVTFMGRVEEKDMPLAYAACDAFVLPTSDLECFGLIALEALSAGRPVLATPVGAIPEIVRKFEPAWLAASAETQGIADLLRQYLTDKLPQHAPAQLHDRANREYRTDQVLDDLIGIAIGGVRNRTCSVA